MEFDEYTDKLARFLHEMYLEAISKLDESSYNKDAAKSFDDLTEEQKFIDRHIASRIQDTIFGKIFVHEKLLIKMIDHLKMLEDLVIKTNAMIAKHVLKEKKEL
ncbi:MAG: hypothetical protein ACXQS8_06505 [Candidatus Helarchaeales archaeon]